MIKKKDNDFTINHALLLAMIVIIVLAFKGYFGGITLFQEEKITNNTIINQLEQTTNTQGSDCKISFSKTVAYIGEEITLRIVDGKNTQCNIYYNYESTGWRQLISIITNNYGVYETSRAAEIAGTYRFAAICGMCLTNYEEVMIRPLPGDGGGSGDDDTGGDDYSGGSEPTVYCTSTWPIPNSQASCDSRTGCPSGQYCGFKPSVLGAAARCTCVTPAYDCASSCLELSMGTGGYCTYMFSKNPCGTNIANLAGNNYCKSGIEGLGVCCCT